MFVEAILVTCGADSCYEEAQTTDIEVFERGGCVVGKMVGPLTDGLLLYEGRCSRNSDRDIKLKSVCLLQLGDIV